MPLSSHLLLQAAGITAGTIAVPRLTVNGATAADAIVPTLHDQLDGGKPTNDLLKAMMETNHRFSKL